MQIAVDALKAQIEKNEAEISQCKAALAALKNGGAPVAGAIAKPKRGRPAKAKADSSSEDKQVHQKKATPKIAVSGKKQGPSPCEKVTDELKERVYEEMTATGSRETLIRRCVGSKLRLTSVLKALESDGRAKREGSGVGTIWKKA